MIKYKNKKNLIVSTVGNNSLHKKWGSLKNSCFDLFLINYGNKSYKNDSKYYIEKKGFKYKLIYECLKNNKILENYEYIWIPDDDILIDNDSIRNLFHLARHYDLWVCQPSIIGWYGLLVTLHNANTKIRFTNHVEIMCPCFKKEALEKCIETFNTNNSGWGVDSLWNIKLGQPTDRIAIIDDVVAIHTRPVGGGELYKNLGGEKFESALEEDYKVWKENKMDQTSYDDLKNGIIRSAELHALNYYNIVEYSRVYKQLEAGVPVENRFWPPNEFIKEQISLNK